ncbi:hypothetical protein FXO37_06125 [Capsicum annuum]|nr:hypothetical protein FXO37_06125 [Capsicum annuum]
MRNPSTATMSFGKERESATLSPPITKAIEETLTLRSLTTQLTHTEFEFGTAIMGSKLSIDTANVVPPTRKRPTKEREEDDQAKAPEKWSGLFSQN